MSKLKPECASEAAPPDRPLSAEIVVITGMSGSGKLTALKAFEDLGFYAVDNLPIALMPKFADLTHESKKRGALIIDIREGAALKEFPGIFRDLNARRLSTLLFLDAEDEVLRRRFSETRRPHPLGADESVLNSLLHEREQLAPIRAIADLYIDTSKLTVHDLRALIGAKFQDSRESTKL
ncbi:MAG: RNase adaptor protein RapZ, partial [Acidobacteriaceae bacterium]|nr:RNase adaptor protein RapZ [Acidobacteriaceae bacterium]